MIKAMAGDTAILGITEENVKRLKEGKPIRVIGDEIGLSHNVVICYGETEVDIVRMLSPSMDENTVINTELG